VRLCEEFPNFRTFRTCYAHVLAVTGGVDAAVEYAVSPWDLAASRILIEEAGGSYIRYRADPEHGTSGVVLGRSDVTTRIVDVLTQQQPAKPNS
jgi:fructose-1,6-bisphosphatase/inositol monophosphatase family enzyme